MEVLVPSEDGAIVARGLAVYCVASAVMLGCTENTACDDSAGEALAPSREESACSMAAWC